MELKDEMWEVGRDRISGLKWEGRREFKEALGAIMGGRP